MAANINDDEYVANLLKQDAKSARKKYDLVGIDAFSHKRCVGNFPGTCYCDRSSHKGTCALGYKELLY
jgi:hypothetical protein